MLHIIRALAPIDIRNVRRDSLLRWMALMPFFFVLLFRFGIPWIQNGILESTGFDLKPYYVLFASYGFVVGIPALFGMVIGFLLLDERDDQTLTALQVTPMSLNQYFIYRITMPVVLSVLLVSITYPLVNIAPLPAGQLFVISLLAAPMAPIFALFLASVAKNKVQGFAIMKGSGAFFILPVAAYFFQSPWTLLLGIIPTYWPLKVFWMLTANESGGWVYVAAGLLWQGVLLFWLVRRFDKVMHQ